MQHLWLAAALLSLASVASATTPGTVAFDYRNAPEWRELVDFERVVLSPRAAPAGDSLRAVGVKVYYWLQPFVASWMGAEVRAWPVDDALWSTATNFSALLSDETSLPVNLKAANDNLDNSYALDFRVPAFPEALGAAVGAALPPSDGLMLDYGCASISWLLPLAKLPISWSDWASGYYRYRMALKASTLGIPSVAACNAWGGWLPYVSDALLLEGVGPPQNLTSPAKAWGLLQGKPETMLLCQSSVPQHRRLLATMALVGGCSFNWRPTFFQGGQLSNARDPEHFDLDLGNAKSNIVIEREGVYRKTFKRGWALVNLSTIPYTYKRRTVAPMDGLVVQDRGPDGRYMAWRTNEGR